MDTVRALIVDAFADEPLAGNGAGVVPDAPGLSESQMTALAGELGQSETVFVQNSDSADRRLRYFAPNGEIDLCGHATIAAHAHLFEDGVIGAGTHSLETGVGTLQIDVDDDGTVWMDQAAPEVEEVGVDHEQVAEALSIDPATLRGIAEDLPLAVASTGIPFLMIPVTYLEAVGNAVPDPRAVEDLCATAGATGAYLFTFDTLDADATLHGRAFAPAVGIREDPVTGTASGAVGAYLRNYGAFDGDLPEEMVLEQGHFVDRPGKVRVRARDRVRVGGSAVTSLDGELAVPADPDEGIVEA